MILLFSENMTYSLGGKWKVILLKKYMEIWYILQMFWKNVLSKKIILKYDLSCNIRKGGISFSWKDDIFSRRKVKDDLSPKKIQVNMFSVYSVEMVFLFPTNMKLPFCQKRKDYLLPKNTYKNGISSITKTA